MAIEISVIIYFLLCLPDVVNAIEKWARTTCIVLQEHVLLSHKNLQYCFTTLRDVLFYKHVILFNKNMLHFLTTICNVLAYKNMCQCFFNTVVLQEHATFFCNNMFCVGSQEHVVLFNNIIQYCFTRTCNVVLQQHRAVYKNI